MDFEKIYKILIDIFAEQEGLQIEYTIERKDLKSGEKN